MSSVHMEVRSLSVRDRLRLLEEIWDSLAETPEAIPVTDAQRKSSRGVDVCTLAIRRPPNPGRRSELVSDVGSEAASPHAGG